MDFNGCAEDWTRPRILILSSRFFLAQGRYMNRLIHLTISSRNHWDTKTNQQINSGASQNGTSFKTTSEKINRLRPL